MKNIFKKNIKSVRYSVTADLLKKGKEPVRKLFSPLVRSKERARLYVILIAERQGYDGVKIRD